MITLSQKEVRELTLLHIDTITSSLSSQLRLQLATQVLYLYQGYSRIITSAQVCLILLCYAKFF
jgi:hypothetical protein